MSNFIKCQYCDEILNNTPRSIGSHVGYHHKEVARTLYDKTVEFTMKCLECDKLVANSNNVLARHLRKEHGIEWPDYIVKYEMGGVWPKCACGCEENLTWKKGGFARFIDGHGQRGQNNPMFGLRGESNPNTGKKRSDAMKARYSKAAKRRWSDPNDPRRDLMASEEYKTKMSKSVKVAFESDEVRQRQISGMLNWWKDNTELRVLYSHRACDLLEQGKIGPQAPYRTEWKFNPFTCREEYMHSSWETRFLDECIERNFPVTKKHGIRILYVDPNGHERTYVPDFITLDGKTLFEVKGYETEVDREKWRATKLWCLENDACFEVVSFQ